MSNILDIFQDSLKVTLVSYYTLVTYFIIDICRKLYQCSGQLIIVILTIIRSFIVFHTVSRSFQNYMQADFEIVFNSVFCTITELEQPDQ